MAKGDRRILLGARIKQARTGMPHENGRHVSQETLASKLGVHWVTVSSWERGKYPPTLDNLLRIAQITGKNLEFFTADDDEQSGDDSDEEAASVLAPLMAALRVLVRNEVDAAAREGEVA
jgi:transcriptional regulator with XRE-family HTH domain